MNSIFVTWPNRLGQSAMAVAMLVTVSLEPVEAQNHAPQQIGLSEVLSRALDNNPITEAADQEIQAVEAEALQAGLWDNPTFSAEIEDFGGEARVKSGGKYDEECDYVFPGEEPTKYIVTKKDAGKYLTIWKRPKDTTEVIFEFCGEGLMMVMFLIKSQLLKC